MERHEHELDDIVGVYEEDGSVKCRDCMNKKDWKNLNRENVITETDIEDRADFIYCDYCEKRL